MGTANKTVGQQLREIRKLRNLTQDEVAKGYGCSRQYINGVETGKFKLGVRGIRKFAKFYNVSVETITSCITEENK